MKVDVKLCGMDKVEEALKHAAACMDEMRKAVSEIHTTLSAVGMEIAQPPEDTNDRA